jgi:hypothetical protein
MAKDTTTPRRKSMAKSTTPKVARDAKTGQFVGGYKVLGTTKDGVKILKPKGHPTHFTEKELRDAIIVVRSGQKAG